MKGKTNTKVIAFAMETSAKTWTNYQLKMPGWYHVLGLGKWGNNTARTYQINSTPTYFVLGKDKQIISIPKTLDELKLVLRELN
jgi:thioredoxin-related protein